VGYIIGARTAGIMFAGGVFSWLVLMPAIYFFVQDDRVAERQRWRHRAHREDLREVPRHIAGGAERRLAHGRWT
jgi:uncharacterized oligopeptide transporter (OPT) family protein